MIDIKNEIIKLIDDSITLEKYIELIESLTKDSYKSSINREKLNEYIEKLGLLDNSHNVLSFYDMREHSNNFQNILYKYYIKSKFEIEKCKIEYLSNNNVLKVINQYNEDSYILLALIYYNQKDDIYMMCVDSINKEFNEYLKKLVNKTLKNKQFHSSDMFNINSIITEVKKLYSNKFCLVYAMDYIKTYQEQYIDFLNNIYQSLDIF